MHDKHTTKGQISVKPNKRGIEFHTFNHERRRMLHIGTLRGSVYEKVAAILYKPEPSFALTLCEYNAAVENGAEFIRIIPQDHAATYSISIEDFKQLATPYSNPFYGDQSRVALRHFQRVSTTAPRTHRADNPIIPSNGKDMIEARRERQLALFGGTA